MTIQNTVNIEAIHRFELFPNSSSIGSQQSFNLYGILIIPQLLGGIIFHYILDVRAISFWIAWVTLAIMLLNIYFFYKRIIERENILKLIISNNHLQIMDNKSIYLTADIERVMLKKNISGRRKFPTIRISSDNFKGISIGLKKEQSNLDEREVKTLSLPDYWLVNEKEWNNLSQQLFNTPYLSYHGSE